MSRPPSISDLFWTFAATVLGLAIGIVACIIVEACR